MKNVCILGGRGFIGRHLAVRLVEHPDVASVRVLDFKTFPPLSGTTGVWGDVADTKKLAGALEGCDTVFHLAANADIAKAATDPAVDFWHGTFLTQCVLEGMRKAGVKRIFYTSGSGVYGDCGETPVHEEMPCRPISPYGASKLASEAMISAYCHMFGMKASVFRFANVVGPRQTHGVGYDFIRKLKADPTKLEIMGDGTQSKSYIHVSDVIDAMLLVAEKQEARYEVFNVATDDYLTVREIALEAFRVAGPMARELVEPGKYMWDRTLKWGTENRGWKGDVPVVRFDCTKIRSLGWKPKYTSLAAMIIALNAMRDEV